MSTPTIGPSHYSSATMVRTTIEAAQALPFIELEQLQSIPFVKNHLELNSFIDSRIRALVLVLTSYVLRDANRKMETFHHEWPATWVQHFKRDCFPTWLLQCFPVRMKQVPFEVETTVRVCPHADIAWPDDAHLHFMTFEDHR